MTPPPQEWRFPLRFWHAAARFFATCYHRVSVPNPCPLPLTGPAILACNHVSGLDPFIIHGRVPRSVVWMMAQEYYQMKSLHWLFATIGAIPVQRSGRDMPATRAAMRALAQGRVLGVFPEGKISTTPDLLPFQVGIALIAIRTGVPVYPVHIDGTQRGHGMLSAVLISRRARIAFGPPVEFDRSSTTRESLEAAAARIQAAVQGLAIISQN